MLSNLNNKLVGLGPRLANGSFLDEAVG